LDWEEKDGMLLDTDYADKNGLFYEIEDSVISEIRVRGRVSYEKDIYWHFCFHGFAFVF